MKYTTLPLAALITASLVGCGGGASTPSSATAVSSAAPVSSAPAVSSVAPASSSVVPASSSVAPASSSVAPASSSVAPASSSIPASSSSVPVSSASNNVSITIEENTTGYCGTSGSGIIDTKHAGFLGAGFVDSENAQGSKIEWQIDAKESAEYTVTLRYALLDGNPRSGTLTANGNAGVIAQFSLAPTGAWTTWQTESHTIALNAGVNRLVLTADTALGMSNLDSLTIAGPGVTPNACAPVVVASSSSGSTSSTGSTPTGSYVYPGPIESGNKGTQSTLAGGFAAPKGAGLPVYSGTTVTGSTLSGARVKFAKSFDEMNSIVAAARLDDAGKKVTSGAYPLMIIYSGNEDSLIAQIVKDHTVDANGNCPKPHWNDTYREVSLKDFTAGITIIGTNGSSANFGITIVNSGNVIIRNMKIGALGGANNDADMIRIDNSPNVWIDHNEVFAVNNECNGSPGDNDLTFESAIDIKKNSDNVTISYNVIRDSKKVGLDGHTQSGGTTDFQRHLTFHHNVYKNVNARLPLQRGGWVHAYNNLYSGITSSGINVRAGGLAIIENNWFENAVSPVTCRYDTNGCGKWFLRGNNTASASDNAKYNISWTDAGSGGINADNWTSTGSFPSSELSYSYTVETPACVRARLESVAGVGKNFAALSCN